jgi:hypothetical protein
MEGNSLKDRPELDSCMLLRQGLAWASTKMKSKRNAGTLLMPLEWL